MNSCLKCDVKRFVISIQVVLVGMSPEARRSGPRTSPKFVKIIPDKLC